MHLSLGTKLVALGLLLEASLAAHLGAPAHAQAGSLLATSSVTVACDRSGHCARLRTTLQQDASAHRSRAVASLTCFAASGPQACHRASGSARLRSGTQVLVPATSVCGTILGEVPCTVAGVASLTGWVDDLGSDHQALATFLVTTASGGHLRVDGATTTLDS